MIATVLEGGKKFWINGKCANTNSVNMLGKPTEDRFSHDHTNETATTSDFTSNLYITTQTIFAQAIIVKMPDAGSRCMYRNLARTIELGY